MARAYPRKGSQSEKQTCGKCGGDGHGTIDWKTVQRIEDDELCFEDNYAHYWDSTGSEVRVWWCNHYEEWHTEEPTVEDQTIWVCGVCTAEWHNEDDAIACCQGR